VQRSPVLVLVVQEPMAATFSAVADGRQGLRARVKRASEGAHQASAEADAAAADAADVEVDDVAGGHRHHRAQRAGQHEVAGA